MFSFPSSPVELEGFSALEQNMDVISPGNGEKAIDFSQIMNKFQGDPQFQQLRDKLAKLKESGLSEEQVNMLQQLITDGKTLPQAAETVFAALQNQLAGLVEKGQLPENLQQLAQQLSALAQLLPEKIKKQLESASEELQQALLPASDKSEKQVASQESSDSTVSKPAELQQQAENIDMLASVVQNVEKQTEKSQSHIQDNSRPNVSAGHPGIASRTTDRPVIFQENYGQLKDIDITLETAKSSVDSKMMLNPSNNLTSVRINPAILNDQLTATSTTAGIGADKGFSGMPFQGQGTSFTQLMSQSLPQPISQNIHKPEWGGAVGDRITWMIGNKLQSAQLRISPAHLGPVEIKLSIEKNLAQVSFVSNHQVVRDALEQAVPRLRDMLNEQNLDLVDVDISDRNQTNTGESNPQLNEHAHGSAVESNSIQSGEPEEQQSEKNAVILETENLLDAYA